jgi:phospholipid-binding lipoprotein MlaA
MRLLTVFFCFSLLFASTSHAQSVENDPNAQFVQIQTAAPSQASASTLAIDANDPNAQFSPMNTAGAGGASNYQAMEVNDQPNDPLEGFNRAMFSFNDTLDTHFLKPVSEVYNKIMPAPMARSIYNIFNNLNGTTTIGNDLLQGNFYQATSDSWRFLINSTAGVAGIFDVANDIGLDANYEDFGLTLARWGYVNSTYVVLPFFGSSTIRDTIGLPVDYYAFSPYSRIDDSRTAYTIYALNIVSKRADLLQYQNLYEQIAIDRYAFMKNAYLQKREGQIQHNKQLHDPYLTIAQPRGSN